MSENEARVRLALEILERFNLGKISQAQAVALLRPLGLPDVVALFMEKTP